VRHIVITTVLGLVSVLIWAYHPHRGEVLNGTALPTRSPAKRSFTFPAVNQYAQAPMHPSSMPTVMSKGFFPARARSVRRNVPRWEGLTSGGAAVMAPTPLPGAQGTMSGHRQLPPMSSDDPSPAK
jgi:hypothetical protein